MDHSPKTRVVVRFPADFRLPLQLAGFIFLFSLAAVLQPLDAMDFGKSTIQLVNGSMIEGKIASIDQTGNVAGDGIPAGLNLEDILSVTTQRIAQPDDTNDATVLTLGGGRILTRDPTLEDEKVKFRSTLGANELPLQATRAIVWSNSSLVANSIAQPSKENDQVIVETTDGDRGVEGILESIDSEFVHINYKGESKRIGLPKVKAVVMADLGFAKPDGSVATINFVDKSKLVGVITEIANDELVLAVGGGGSVKLKTSNIMSFSIASDRLMYLSDLEPTEVQEKSIFAIQRPWNRDRSVENNVLKIRAGDSEKTVEFVKGLGTQSSSRLVFANSHGFDRFKAVAGIDAETRGRGDCRMVVRGDGIELWSKRVRASDGPQEIDVDISGMKQVALIVYPGEEFDLGDHADWADARFLKTN